jgi:hypothetical protein
VHLIGASCDIVNSRSGAMHWRVAKSRAEIGVSAQRGAPIRGSSGTVAHCGRRGESAPGSGNPADGAGGDGNEVAGNIGALHAASQCAANSAPIAARGIRKGEFIPASVDAVRPRGVHQARLWVERHAAAAARNPSFSTAVARRRGRPAAVRTAGTGRRSST